MSDAIITVENLSKKYLVGHKTGRPDGYIALRDVLLRGARNAVRRTIDMARGRQVLQGDEIEEFWALKDVSFEIKRGEVLGIIGRNGAGKSTLLKILSRITEPTGGRVTLRGRVASLLEVGTGFHQELTGRENIYLNAAILGMSRRETTQKFDEIVAFAEVEKFLDTPVKHYSSGMYVRLAFAVAAHLETEILLVDEVLAVGDAAFQKKCLGKMSEVARDNRTVLFVSHNMAAMQALTRKCIWLERGCVVGMADTQEIAQSYFAISHEDVTQGPAQDLATYREYQKDDPEVTITGIGVNGSHQGANGIPILELGAKVTIELALAVTRPLRGGIVHLIFKTIDGDCVTAINSDDHHFTLFLEPGCSRVHVKCDDLSLAPGRYCLSVAVDVGVDCIDLIRDYPLLSIVNRGQIVSWFNRPWGVVHCREVHWSTVAAGPVREISGNS